MSGECVYGCKHPLWGGAGECITANDPTADNYCVCDEGYASSDSFGNPSCVPVNVLVGLFAMVALVNTTTTAVMLWHLARHFLDLTESARSTRKAIVRLRLIISCSLSSIGFMIVFWSEVAGGGDVSLWEGGKFFVVFGLSYPAGLFAGLQVGELWLDHLPLPLVKPGSTLAKVKALATERDLLFWGGLASAGNVFVISALSLFFGQRLVRHVLHLIMGASTIVAAMGFMSVAVFLTRAINVAAAKSPQSWHSRAKRNIRVEAGILIVASVVYTASVVLLELTHEGGNTPLIPFAAMVIVAAVAHVAVVVTSKPGAAKPAGVRRSAASRKPLLSSVSAASPHPSAIFVKISTRIKKVMGDEDRESLPPIRSPVVFSRASRSTTTGGTANNNKIVPTISEDPIVPFEVEQSMAEPSSIAC